MGTVRGIDEMVIINCCFYICIYIYTVYIYCIYIYIVYFIKSFFPKFWQWNPSSDISMCFWKGPWSFDDHLRCLRHHYRGPAWMIVVLRKSTSEVLRKQSNFSQSAAPTAPLTDQRPMRKAPNEYPNDTSKSQLRLGATLARCCLSIPQIDRLKAGVWRRIQTRPAVLFLKTPMVNGPFFVESPH